MDILILVGQRKQAYEDQYAPEVLAAIDSDGNDENPDYMIEMRADAEKTKEFESLAVILVRVPWHRVHESLYPAQQAIAGTVEPQP